MNPYIKIIRPINLLMVVLTQLLFWFFVITPIHSHSGTFPDLAFWQVSLLILSTVLIAAGGYVINDYYDLPIDLVNKPDKVIVSDSISDENAFNYYIGLSVAGLISSLIVGITIGNISLVILPVIIASLLWFYAQTIKRMFVLGNLVVSIASAAVIFIIIWFEIDWNHVERIPFQARSILRIGGAYMLFAFVTSMLRELIKDLQDKQGDEEFGCKTMPIVAGVNISKLTAGFYVILLLVGFGIIVNLFFQQNDWLHGLYITLLLALPSIVILLKLFKAKTSNNYSSISTWIKAIMFFGIITMIYFGFAV